MSTYGVDIGSSYLTIVRLHENKIESIYYAPHRGNFDEVLKNFDFLKEKVAYTGINSYRYDGKHPFFVLINYAKQYKDLRHIVYVGASSYFIINLDEEGNYTSHVSNSTCASGTGSFLDLQAFRLGYSVEELGTKALTAKVSPSVSTRCSVFAKTDLIHLQQEGYTKEEIAAGLCRSLAENIIDVFFKGSRPAGKILLTGGVFQNKALFNEFCKRFGEENIICENPHLALATGAAIVARDRAKRDDVGERKGLFHLLAEKRYTVKNEVIKRKIEHYPDFSAFLSYVDEHKNEVTIYDEEFFKRSKGLEIGVFMGIDIGSTSTKACLIDEKEKVLLSVYRKTASDPINACKLLFNALRNIEKSYGVTFSFKGVATTGSGRKMIKEVINADDAINEITAHAIAAVFIDKDVDTIIEIGGQDSKFTKLKDGIVTYAVMNYVCAAGTGSFIEEQAEKLGINLAEFANLAENTTPPPTSDRCTVFMEKDIDLLIAAGVPKGEIAGAVLLSVRENYLNKVVGNVPMGKKIYFQGATARNRALVAVFEQRLGQPIYVSPYCHITGALGCALHIKSKNLEKSKFYGLSFSEKETLIEKEECALCVNKCALSIIVTDNEKVAWGMKCGRDYHDTKPKKVLKNPFTTERKLEISFDKRTTRGKVYLPDFLANAERLGFFYKFLTELGIEPILVSPNKSDYEEGRKRALQEICAPCVITFGAVSRLKEYPIFMPYTLRNNIPNGLAHCHLCPLSQAMPSVLKMLFPDKIFLTPKFFESLPYERQAEEFLKVLSPHFHLKKEEIVEALAKSYQWKDEREKERYEKGEKFISEIKEDEVAVIILGRPYLLYNNFLNHGLIDIFSEYGIKALPVDFLKPDYDFLARHFPHMYWNYGQRILSSLKVISERPSLFPVLFTCFSCGPDSFILNYFYKEMEALKKPFLTLQFDGHSSATGYITRIEAAIDSFKNFLQLKTIGKLSKYSYKVPEGQIDHRKILVPPMDKEGAKLLAASFQRFDVPSETLEETDLTFREGLKYSLGQECSPYHSTLGALLYKLKNNGKEDLSYFMPTGTGPCRFGQYAVLQDVVLKELNFDVNILSPSGENAYSGLPLKLRMILFDVIIINDILRKVVLSVRPYEVNSGETDAVYRDILEKLCKVLREKGDYIEVYEGGLRRLKAIKIENGNKPKIGIVGEIYVRSNAFLNDDLIKTIEFLGGEARISTVSEWFFYTLFTEKRELKEGFYGKVGPLSRLRLYLKNKYYYKREHYLYGIAHKYFDVYEPTIDEVMARGSEYLPMEFLGEAILTVGRAVIFFEKEGVDAVVNASPTFCMPGTLSSYLLKGLERRYKKPAINLFYDKTGKPNLELIPYLELLKNR